MPTSLKETLYRGWIYDHLLSPEECARYRDLLDRLAYEDGDPHQRYFQDIVKLPQVASELWKAIRKDLPRRISRDGDVYELAGLSDHITVSRHRGKNIGIHRDKDVRVSLKGRRVPDGYCFYKLAIYLNDLSDPYNPRDTTGGTSFYDKRENWLYTAKPQEGRGVLFDMREWHSGAYVPPGETKYMLGARPFYRKVKRDTLNSSYDHSREKPREKTREKSKQKSRERKHRNYCPHCDRYH